MQRRVVGNAAIKQQPAIQAAQARKLARAGASAHPVLLQVAEKAGNLGFARGGQRDARMLGQIL